MPTVDYGHGLVIAYNSREYALLQQARARRKAEKLLNIPSDNLAKADYLYHHKDIAEALLKLTNDLLQEE